MPDSANTETVTDLADLGSAMVEAGTETPAAPAAPTMPLRDKIVDAQGRAYATGRRKDAVARVWIKPGSGKVTINGRDQEVYFARPTLRLVIDQPFQISDRAGQYEVRQGQGPQELPVLEALSRSAQADTQKENGVGRKVGPFFMAGRSGQGGRRFAGQRAGRDPVDLDLRGRLVLAIARGERDARRADLDPVVAGRGRAQPGR